MEKHSFVRRRFARSLAACAIFTAGVVLVAPQESFAAAKVTVCHRTRSVTNPYRRITVAQSAVTNNAGHKSHDIAAGVFNTTAGWYNTRSKIWGDIIPGNSDGGSALGGSGQGQNWSAAGQAILLPTGTNASKCSRMTAKQFYDVQVAAGLNPSDVIDELNDMGANEDQALLDSLGAAFSAANLSTWAAAVAVTTTAATSIVDGTGSNGSASLNGSLKFASGQTIRWYFELSTSPTFASLINTSQTKTYDTSGNLPFSLTANGSTQTVSPVSVTGLSQGTYYFRLVGISDYTTDVEGVLYGETKSFSILMPYITTETLTDATVNTAYSATIAATGGTLQKTNFRLDSGSLPTGLSITNPGTPDSTATLSGTPGSGTQGLYTLPFITDDQKSGTPNTSAVKELVLRIKAPQIVTVPTPSAKTYGDPAFNINATSNVTADEIGDLGSFTSYTGTAGVCSVSSSGAVTILAAGSCTVTANHSGNGYWLAGSNSVTFNIATRAITVKAGNKSKVVNGTEPTPSVSVTVGSLVSPDVLSGATYDWGGTSSIPNTAGSYTITPSAATFSTGSASNYTIIYDTGTLTVTASAAAQSIDFPDPADRTWGAPNFTIGATSKDGSTNTDLQVSFTSSTPLVCTVGTASKTSGVSNVTVTIVKAGTCTIETSQAGGSNGSLTYAAATNVSQSIVISPRPITIKADDKSKEVDGTDPAFTYAVTVGALVGSDAISGLTYTHSSSSYTASTSVPNVVGSYTITPSAAVFSTGVAANYTITYLTGTLTVSAASTTTSSSTSTTAAPATTAAATTTTKATTTTAAPTTTVPKVDPRKTTDNPFVNISADPKPNGKSTGGR